MNLSDLTDEQREAYMENCPHPLSDCGEPWVEEPEEVVSEHTPGPWRVAARGTHVFAGGAYCVALCGMSDEDMANARLIAAAPELLEAVRLCADSLDTFLTILSQGENDPIYLDAWQAMDAARAAITKATGGEA